MDATQSVIPGAAVGRGVSRRALLGAGLTVPLGLGLQRPAVAGEDPAAAYPVLRTPAPRVPKALAAAMLAVARAGTRLVAVGERGIVLLSDDGGQSWRQATVPVRVALTGVRFVDARRGWAIGHLGTVLRTDDAGATWQRQFDGLAVIASLQTQASGGAAADTVATIIADGPDKPFLALDFTSPDEGWVLGAYGLAFETKDAGKTWRSIGSAWPNPRGLHLYGVARRGAQVLVVGEQGLLMASDDGGRTLEPRVSPYPGTWFGVLALRDGGWLAYGLRGALYRGDAGAAHWERVATGISASWAAAFEDTGGIVHLASQDGDILSSQDGGRTFHKVTSLAGFPISDLQPGNGRDLVAVGLRGTHRYAANLDR